MKTYELTRLAAGPFLPVLQSRVGKDLSRLVAGSMPARARVLDVGGRKSPYTVGLPADVTILDLPRKEELQKRLNLGVSEEILGSLRRRRSNIREVILQDMTRCALASSTFDGVVSIEVLEHVPNDEEFVRQVVRVLRAGGWFYMTTPNGDYIRNEPPNYNPDHVRHYTRQQLLDLLSRHFSRVRVVYGVLTGPNRFRGLRSMHLSRPLRTLQSATSNVLSHLESRGLDETPRRTAHLFATAWK